MYYNTVPYTQVVSHVLPSHLHLIRDLRADRMRSPELDQQPVQVMSLLTNRSPKLVCQGTVIGSQGDLLKVLGFDGSERLGDPLHIRPGTQKHQVFEFRGFG